MPGLFSSEMAIRYANYRLALAQYERWRVSFGLFDPGILVSPGDVWTVTAPNGLAHDVRIVSRSSRELGSYDFVGVSYSASVYEEATA